MSSSMPDATSLLDRLRQLLAPPSSTDSVAKPNQTKKPTFASLLCRKYDLSELPKQLPLFMYRMDITVVKSEPEVHREQLDRCKTNMIGRIVLRPGSKSIKVDELKTFFHRIWQPEQSWLMTTVACSFFDIHFSDEMDMKKVLGSGICSLAQGVCRLYQWQQNFNPYDPKFHSHSRIWIHLCKLSMEYQHPRILMTFTRGVGIPLQVDRPTREKKYGFYARILVAVDLSQQLPVFVTVKLLDYGFVVEVHYENLPTKYTGYNRYGYSEHKKTSN